MVRRKEMAPDDLKKMPVKVLKMDIAELQNRLSEAKRMNISDMERLKQENIMKTQRIRALQAKISTIKDNECEEARRRRALRQSSLGVRQIPPRSLLRRNSCPPAGRWVKDKNELETMRLIAFAHREQKLMVNDLTRIVCAKQDALSELSCLEKKQRETAVGLSEAIHLERRRVERLKNDKEMSPDRHEMRKLNVQYKKSEDVIVKLEEFLSQKVLHYDLDVVDSTCINKLTCDLAVKNQILKSLQTESHSQCKKLKAGLDKAEELSRNSKLIYFFLKCGTAHFTKEVETCREHFTSVTKNERAMINQISHLRSVELILNMGLKLFENDSNKKFHLTSNARVLRKLGSRVEKLIEKIYPQSNQYPMKILEVEMTVATLEKAVGIYEIIVASAFSMIANLIHLLGQLKQDNLNSLVPRMLIPTSSHVPVNECALATEKSTQFLSSLGDETTEYARKLEMEKKDDLIEALKCRNDELINEISSLQKDLLSAKQKKMAQDEFKELQKNLLELVRWSGERDAHLKALQSKIFNITHFQNK